MENTGEVITFVQEFAVEKKLKTSPRGSVFLVRDLQTRGRYIYRQFNGSAEVYRRLCGVACAHLPRILAVKEENGRVSVLEEYVQGDTLAFLLEGKPLEASQVRKIALQLCQALEVLHSVGAVHRDVKPENILIRGGDAVLIDFDASRVSKAESLNDTQIMGTTGYAAPEQYGFSQTDARADIYSMGILLNEMLTKQHPSKCLASGKLRPVIERCIEVNVDKRYTSASELGDAIQACGEEKRKKRGSLAAAVLVLCAVGALWGMLRGEPETVEPQETEGIQAAEIFQREKVEISDGYWRGSISSYETPFRYDLDGDGELEDYRFGIYHACIPEGYRHTLSDNSGVAVDDICQRDVYPCVWKYHEDTTVEMVEEFADLLTNETVTLWREQGNEAPAPDVYSAEGIFSGGLQVLYTIENRGTWVYEIRAELDGQELTAVARSNISGVNGT